MKTLRILYLAALALTMAACTSEEFTQEQNSQPEPDGSKGIPFTASISCNATTRAISENTTDGTLVTSWEVNDKVALIHKDKNDNTVKDEMTVSAVDATTKTATITGTITGSPADGDEVRLLYPASAASESGEIRADLLNVQAGTLDYIQKNLDLRMSNLANPTKLKVADGSATIDGTVALKNELAIVKFSLKNGSDALAAESFEITDITNQQSITVEPSPAASDIYVAMESTAPNTTHAFSFAAKKGDKYYCFSKSGITIEAGKYYQQNLTLADMLHTPLTLQAAEAGAKVTFKADNNYPEPKDIEYSTDGGVIWKAGNTGGEGVEVTLTNVGDKVMFRGNNSQYGKQEGTSLITYNTISCTADCYVYGNIMSLISADNFATLTELTATFTFSGLFSSNHHLISSAYTLELPATTLTEYCYRNMFLGCKLLVTPPALPATELKKGCYSGMFFSCTSLETTPKLRATVLQPNCYNSMFDGCTSLKEAWVKADYKSSDPDYECYKMFAGCKSGGVLHTASTSTAWTPGTAMPGDWTIEKDY